MERHVKTNTMAVRKKTSTRKPKIEEPKQIIDIGLVTGHRIEYVLSQIVYLRTDREQRQRYVVGIELRPSNMVKYALIDGTAEGVLETWHYGFEINDERDILLATS